LGVLPVVVVRWKYAKLYNRLQSVFADGFTNETIYFCEYLDNSIGYFLKKSGVIKDYINDLHGVATLEFKFQAQLAKSPSDKIKFYTKYKISDWLDNKVCNKAQGLIFASQAMKDYFIAQYPKIANKRHYILPYVLSSGAIEDQVEYELKKQLEAKFHRVPHEKIIFFAGAFKKTGGVPDLIAAFAQMVNNYDTRLFLVGDGPTMNECQDLVAQYQLKDKVLFIGRIPYHQLRTYQDLADIIVCPDKQNVYSELIVHVKYLDSLLSRKVVINGSFKSVQEINPNQLLSINFTPSDVASLSTAITYAIDHHEALLEQYKNNVDYVAQHLTYASQVAVLEDKV
jgi:glycosyltransferase involved in cell wall biosynthesis